MKKVLFIFSLVLTFTYMAQAKRDTTDIAPTKIVVAIKSELGTITMNGETPKDSNIVNGDKVYYGTYDVDGDGVALKAFPKQGYGFQQWERNDPDPYTGISTNQSNPFALSVYSDDGYINVNTTPMTFVDTIFIIAKYFDNTVCNYLFPISEHGYFNPSADKLGVGSSLAIDSSKTDAGIPAIIYTQAKGEKYYWPWINLDFELSPYDSVTSIYDGTIKKSLATLNEDVKAIQITYKVKTTTVGGEWKVFLPFNKYLFYGDGYNWFGGGDHMVVLPKNENGNYLTYTAYMTDFKVPAWYNGNPDSAIMNPIIGNLDKVKKIGFRLNDDARNGQLEGELYIKSINLCGMYVTNIARQQQLNEITINSLVNNALQINAQNNGNYFISIYSIDGKKVFDKNINLNNGYNSIQIGAKLTNGIYMVRVSNENGIVTKKICSMK